MELPTSLTYPVLAALEQWTDQREVHADDVEALVLFHTCVPKALSQWGYKYCGHICKRVHMQCLLTVKVTQEGVPLVVFVTSTTTIGSMHRFLDLLESDRLTWVKDKYPWN